MDEVLKFKDIEKICIEQGLIRVSEHSQRFVIDELKYVINDTLPALNIITDMYGDVISVLWYKILPIVYGRNIMRSSYPVNIGISKLEVKEAIHKYYETIKKLKKEIRISKMEEYFE